MLHNTFEVIV